MVTGYRFCDRGAGGRDMARRRSGLSFYRRRKKLNTNVLKQILIWIIGIVIAVFVGFAIVYCVGIRTSIIGDSMSPTLSNGQEIYINRIVYHFRSPRRNDVIVFTPPSNERSHYYVKRVIALPGETIQIKGGRIYINGKLYDEDRDIYDLIEDPGIAEEEIVLGKDEYFVLGDNRNNSEDSRSANIGPVKRSMIFGRAWLHMAGSGKGMGLIQ